MKTTFDFAKKRLYQKAAENDVEITNFYMIGDNPHADIKGGNDNDCVSILVKTGVYSGKDQFGEPIQNDSENPAKHVVDDMEAAYRLILQQERLTEHIKFQ